MSVTKVGLWTESVAFAVVAYLLASTRIDQMTPAPPYLACNTCGAEQDERDLFCSSCGMACQPVPLSIGQSQQSYDPALIWLGEIGLSDRTASILAASGKYVLADVSDYDDDALLRIRNIGPRSLSEIRASIALLSENSHLINSECEARRGSCYDPSSPALGTDFLPTIMRSGFDPDVLSVDLLRLTKTTRTLFHKARIRSLGDAGRLTTLALIQQLNPRTPNLLEELAAASEQCLAELQHQPVQQSPVERPGNPVLDGFLGLEQVLQTLPERSRVVLEMQFGLDGQPPRTLEESGALLGVTRERIRQIKGKALTKLAERKRLYEPAFSYLNSQRQTLGLSWEDPRLAHAFVSMAGTDFGPYLQFLPLLSELFVPKGTGDNSVSDFDDAVVAVLSRTGPRPLEDLAAEVRSFLDPDRLTELPTFSVAQRIEVLGPAIRGENGWYELPPTPIEGLNDRKMRRLQTMCRVLETFGPSHFSVIAREVDRLLPSDYRMSERDVHSWLMRYSGIFVWAGQGRYGLKSQDVGIRAEQQATALEPVSISRSSRRKGIGDEIASLLAETSPLHLDLIEAHILSRFAVQNTSVIAAIKQDRAARFHIDENRFVALR